MKTISVITGPAVALREANVDTDVIFPARFLVITASEGLGRYGFFDRRFDVDGKARPICAFNRPELHHAPILIAGANFGCGSSREQAVWAIKDMGFSCIIAPSFGEIFAANCARNGILIVCLSEAEVEKLIQHAEAGAEIKVDLQNCTVMVGGQIYPFFVVEHQRQALLNGWDETDAILANDGAAIADFESRQKMIQPWLHVQQDSI